VVPPPAHPPWKRFRRLKPETPQGDVEYFLAELLGMYSAARAMITLEGIEVEILRTRRGRMIRYKSP
jgi:hypothetical protein